MPSFKQEKNSTNKLNNSSMTTSGEYYNALSKHLADESEIRDNNQ